MVESTSRDILLGRGVRINNHPGNEAYREIISQNAVRTKKEWMYELLTVAAIDVMIDRLF